VLVALRWLALATAASAAHSVPAEPRGPCPEDEDLGRAVGAVLRADYRGDRTELARLARELSAKPPHRNRVYWHYWAGFALWRRGMNGFEETPRPGDLLADFERCAELQRAALAIEPAFADARSALSGCLMGRAVSSAEATPERRKALLQEAMDVLAEVEPGAEGNPRSLWMVGGRLMWAPPERGGDRRLAEATFLRGVEAARREALGPRREPWVPSWGAAENLMSLAFLHTLGPSPDRAVARAYAEGALALVPDWHYVRDVLLPRIEKLSSAPAAAPAVRQAAPRRGRRAPGGPPRRARPR
jgi:hypothetical protein